MRSPYLDSSGGGMMIKRGFKVHCVMSCMLGVTGQAPSQ